MKNDCLGGKVLYLDLSTGEISYEPTVDYMKRFLGGRGVNNWLLFKHTDPNISPLDPRNVLLFGTGTLVGTSAPGANRMNVVAKSPVTNGIGSSSVGGQFAPVLRFAGYDHLVFMGRNRRLCYVYIDDNKVEIRDASHLKGKTTGETENRIRRELGCNDLQIASIGPAGENLVMASCIIVGRGRAAGRCGLGAVMGSKNLKAVAVRGSGAISVVDSKKFTQVVKKILEKMRNAEQLQEYAKYGTPGGVPVTEPIKNFQDEYLDPSLSKRIQSELLSYMSREDSKTKSARCWNCPVECAKYYKIQDGTYAGTECGKLEYNSLTDFCYKLGIYDAASAVRATVLCTEYGLDIDNAAGVIAWAFECYQRGIISKQDTGGIELEWGNHRVVMDLLHKMAYRIGFGDILAHGSNKASKIIGRDSSKYSVHTKGQELKEPIRAYKSWALGIVISGRGGGHTTGAPLIDLWPKLFTPRIITEMWGRSSAGGPTTYEGKAKIVVYYEKLHAVLDSLGICFFISKWCDPDLPGPNEYSELFSAATGIDISSQELMTMGERIHNTGKVLNILHARFSRKDDYPPERLMKEAIKSGSFKGERLDKQEWEKMLNEYYEFHGWDKCKGWPTSTTLRELKLGEMETALSSIRQQMVNFYPSPETQP